MKKVMNWSIRTVFCLVLVLVLAGSVFAYDEAPMLKERVKNGALPPVEERLPEASDVYVVSGSEIGKYGGTIRTATLSPSGYGDDNNLSIFPNPIKPTADGTDFEPHVLRKLEISDDMSVYTLHLRRGMRWSDGHPFTADDIMFYFEDMIFNPEYTAHVSVPWRVGDELVVVEKLDDYTVRLTFPEPQPFFKESLVHMGAWNLYFPKHYLQQFHPTYTDRDELEKMVKEAGFETWKQLFSSKNAHVWGQSTNPDRPTLATFVLVEATSTKRVWERNPYYWKVDEAGNQLPYMDRIEAAIVSDVEVVQGMIMSGQLDFAGMNADIRNYPLYKKYEAEGNIQVVLWETGMGSDVIYNLNLTHKDPVLREIFQDVRFRRALSLGINREQINESIYFGQAVPRQYTVLESNKYFKPEYAASYVEYDPDKANQLLDEMGLDKRDSEGFRLRPDGKRLSFTVEYMAGETPKQPNVEIVTENWKQLGIDATSKLLTGELLGERIVGNMADASLWHGDKGTNIYFPKEPGFMVPSMPARERTTWPEWERWYTSGGEAGEEPPAHIKELRNWYEEILQTTDADALSALAHNILQAQAENLWVIGTVGNSPFPIVLNKDVRNFPEQGYWVWDTLWSCSHDPGKIWLDR